MRIDRLAFECSLRLLLLLDEISSPIEEEKASCLDFICRTPASFGLEGKMFEGENPLAFSLFLSSIPITRKGILGLMARNLVKAVPTSSGLTVEITEAGKSKASLLTSEMESEYRKITRTVLSKFGHLNCTELTDLINIEASRKNHDQRFNPEINIGRK